MSKFDRSAYNNWQARETGRQERIENGHDFWGKDPEPVQPARRDISVNQASTRAGLAKGELSILKGRGYGGASVDLLTYDDFAHDYLSVDEKTPRFAQARIEARAERIAKGDFTIDRMELFAIYEQQGKKLTSSIKRKIFAAEQARMEEARAAWQAERDREELDELAINIANEVNLNELGFGAW